MQRQDDAATARPRGLSCSHLVVLLSCALVGSSWLAVALGPVTVPTDTVVRVLAHHLRGGGDTGSAFDLIVWDLRLPRTLLAVAVGAGLAIAGAVVQAVVRNPVAEPYLLGLSSGASVGAVLVISAGAGAASLSIPSAAFIGATAAMAVVLLLARHHGRLLPLRLILVGVVCAHLFSGVTSFILTRVNDSAAQQQIIFWMLGGLSGAQWQSLRAPAVVLVACLGFLLLRARRINVVTLGDDAASALGVRVSRLRLQLLVCATLLTGTMVASSGGIGFIGLVVPHVARMLAGADHRRMLPVAALMGALFLVWCDVAARMLLPPAELPIGILTAFVGAPLFLVVMRSRGMAGGDA